MIGRNWRVPLALLVGVNNALGPNAAFAVATVLAIAASVALSTSLEMTSRGIQLEAERNSAALAGAADIEIVGGDLGVPETLVAEVAATPGVLVASPLINAVVQVDAARMPLHILGIDLTLAADSRELEVQVGGVRINDPLRLLARPDSVLITEPLSARIGVGLGGSFTVHSQLGEHALRVEGMLESRGVANAFNGQVAVMDVYALQMMLGRENSIDRIDVVAKSGVDLDSLTQLLEATAAGTAEVRRFGGRRTALEQTASALRVVVVVVATIGSLASGLLSYAAMSTAVERRLRELYVLRSTGLSARSIALWISMDVIAVATVGTCVGIAFGSLLADRLLPTLSQVSEFFVTSPISRSNVAISRTTIALAIAVGVACTLCGAIGPTRLATRRYALEALDGRLGQSADGPSSLRRRRLSLAFTLAATIAAILPCWPPSIQTVLILGVGTALAMRCAIPGLNWLNERREFLSRLLPGTGHLLGTGLLVRPRSSALAVAAIASLVAFVHGAIIVSASFSHTLLEMVASRYPDAIMVTAEPPFVDGDPSVVSRRTISTIRDTSGVDQVVERFSSTILFRDEEVSILAFPAGTPGSDGMASDGARNEARLTSALLRGEVAVSTAFAKRFSLNEQSKIELPTRQGRTSFRIAGEIPGLAGPNGIIFVDLAVFDRFWERPGATSLFIWMKPPREATLDEIRRRTDDLQPLFFTSNRELAEAARIFAARFDGLLYGVATLAIVLGSIAVANLLAGMVSARRIEFALLRATGASPGQLGVVVIGDALLVCVAGLVAGGILGYLISAPMLDLMSAEFGLRVVRRLDMSRFFTLSVAVLLGVALSAMYPAWLSRRSGVPVGVSPD